MKKREETLLGERFDEAITVVGIKGWAVLLASLLLFIPLILWMFLGTIPTAVSGKCLLFSPSANSTANLEIYGFLPLYAGQSVEPGMEVECSLDAVEASKAGMLEGRIREVLPYPVDLTESHMQQIPSDSLKQYLLNSSIPLILVIAEPKKDPRDPSQFAWTYYAGHTGPAPQVQSGMTGEATVILERKKPISYVIPSW